MKNNSGKINIMVVIIILMANIIIIGLVYFLLFANKQPPQQAPMQRLPQAEAPRRQEESRSSGRSFSDSGFSGAKDYTRDFALFSVGDIIVNTSGTNSSFFITSVLVEYRQADRRLPPELTNKAPMFRDRMTGYFSRLTADELRDMDNRDIFRDDIMRLINNMLIEGRITDVIFEQFVIQG